ncbi:sigma 54-interacting transcriptional regulator [Salmonella enterica subsp. enterica]|nr:sigma 54-interacting transcriptional regulator [Salmonella enterica subsp. enterica]
MRQLKTALFYPRRRGLPLLMTGSGTGKSYLAQLMLEICHRRGAAMRRMRHLSVFNCARYASNPRTAGGECFWLCEGRVCGARGATNRARSGRLTAACYFWMK